MIKDIGTKELGYTDISVSKKKRRSWRNYATININFHKMTSRKTLRQKKKQMILSGEIDVGIPIVPVEFTVIRINKQGKLVSNEYFRV